MQPEEGLATQINSCPRFAQAHQVFQRYEVVDLVP